MTSLVLPEEILGLPLYVPSANNYFEIEAGGMPNGDPCLKVRGDLSRDYRAVMTAPTLSKDICNAGDTSASFEWSMSCWVKMSVLSTPPTNDIMFGCSNYSATAAGLFGNTRNTNVPFLFGMNATTGAVWFREVINNVVSPNDAKCIQAALSMNYLADHWVLLVFNHNNTGSVIQCNIYADTIVTALVGDTAGNGLGPNPFIGPRLLHIGPASVGAQGRNDVWRMGKWAFHDHILTLSERQAMWQAMMWTAGHPTYTDDFNRATLGTRWVLIPTFVIPVITSNEVVGGSNTSRAIVYNQDLGGSNMYAQVSVTSKGTGTGPPIAGPMVRVVDFGASTSFYLGTYNATGYSIFRNGTVIASSGSVSQPSFPYTLRLEVETVAGDPVLRLYANGSLVVTFTDTNVAKITTGQLAGLYVRGQTAPSTVVSSVDNFQTALL